MSFVAVKDFDHFQHYKGRTPPWIKFYNALLDDYRFLQLPDSARSQLMLIWLVASRHANRIPNDPKYIAEAIHCTTKLQLDKLLDSGWLYNATEQTPQAERKRNASKPLAKRPQNALLEREIEEEEEKEIEEETTNSTTSTARAELLDQLPEDYRPDLEAFLRGVGSEDRQLSWIKSMDAHLTGLRTPMVTGEVLGSCIRQFVGNGDRPNWRLFERYLQTEQSPQTPPGGKRNGQSRAPTVDDLKGRAMLILGELRSKRIHHSTGHASGYVIAQSDIDALDPATKKALVAIGGANKVANHPDDSFSILTSQFAAMYQAALSQTQPVVAKDSAA